MENAEINKVISLMIAELSADGSYYTITPYESHYIIVRKNPLLKGAVTMYSLSPALMVRMANDSDLRNDIISKIQRSFMNHDRGLRNDIMNKLVQKG